MLFRIWLGLWILCLTPLSQNFSYIMAVSFIGGNGVPWENHRPATIHWRIYYIMLYRVYLARSGFEYTTPVVIGTACIGSCLSNYHMITTTTVHVCWLVPAYNGTAYYSQANDSILFILAWSMLLYFSVLLFYLVWVRSLSCVLCTMLTVSLCCLFLIVPSILI